MTKCQKDISELPDGISSQQAEYIMRQPRKSQSSARSAQTLHQSARSKALDYDYDRVKQREAPLVIYNTNENERLAI